MENTFTAISKSNFVTIVEVDNPPANTLSSASIAELRSVFHTLATDEATRAIILTGLGRFFIAGADIKEFVAVLGNEAEALAMATAGQALCDEIEAMNKPVIAAINGPALGGGLEVALGCHYRIAADDAILGLPELKLGLLPAFGGTQRLSRITNPAIALEIILKSKQVTSKEAYELGIIQKVVTSEELLSTAIKTAESFIEEKSMTSITRTIECIMQGYQEDIQQGLKRERHRFAELFNTKDAKEGIHAFVEKRKPKFIQS
ncbi:enoyl-CoA hydratase-related protein [Brevibacillus laterosporus]|uniref:Enoyl-CoA hydratase-related protein n=1 Tax=Brevibacillus laterosporus TaxID=1465 RepID=A0AAP3DHK6_BRELA|nr:enoyl-CoA hydratase-related protein [Brevibacillus laterosporus]MCR8980622.1 enoyl-CoA hydratase-related protein [Brevibacillus laterosporus]MCZ0807777.1 enoyl-CoA hydratase-related protein [Brevibacillus laterosporus]MCZ0826053.1 enoyl-CoA hydratase-related protein [Brevibacillus laterosporus]MCZ0849780.1 enoyl-CoA hydratase-related protein [Brevibacillus laterosporus]